MEKQELLEGKKIDNLEGTSTSENIVEEEDKELEPVEEPVQSEADAIPDLSASPIPTEEEVKDANLAVAPEEVAEPVEDKPVEAEAEISAEVESTELPAPSPAEPDAIENVETPVHEENGVTETPALKTFTQSQVNDLVGKTRMETREQTYRYIYDRYGVNNEEELDDLIGNAQRYDTLQEEFDAQRKGWKEQSSLRDKELEDVKTQVALLQSGIDSERFEDAKFILKGKGLEVNLDNIKSELATHPEWQKKVGEEAANPNFAKVGEPNVDTSDAEPVSKISVLGNESAPSKVDSEEDFVMKRMFKV